MVALLVCAASANADRPTPEHVSGSGTVAGAQQYDLSLTAGPFGEQPTGHLHLAGPIYNFDAVPTCINMSGSEVVAGFRITTGDLAGHGFLYASAPAQNSVVTSPGWVPPDPSLPNEVTIAVDPGSAPTSAPGSTSPSGSGGTEIRYAGVLAAPPLACPPPGAAPPSFTGGSAGGIVDTGNTAEQSGGPAHPIPLQQLTFPGAAGATALAQASDGSMWFLDRSANTIGTVPNDASGRVTSFSVTTAAAGLGAIAPDTSGTCDATGCTASGMWFTESTAGNVGHVTTGGHVDEYPTHGDPSGIAPDDATGGAWFTEPSGNRIGHISTTGTVTEYPVLSAGARPSGIAADPGGGAWFTEPGASRIGFVSAAGAVSEYPVDAGAPQAIASDPTGGAWFTLPAANALGHIDGDHLLQSTPVPTADAGLSGLVAGSGPDGSSGVWFAESRAGLLGYLSTTGADVAEYTLRGATPGALALADPFGAPPLSGYDTSQAVWFTDAGGGGIGVARFPDGGGYGGWAIPVASGLPGTVKRPPPLSAVLASRIRIHGWSVSLRLHCNRKPLCTGRAQLTTTLARKTHSLAARRYRIRGGRTVTVRLTLGIPARRLLRHHHRLRVRVLLHEDRQRTIVAGALMLHR